MGKVLKAVATIGLAVGIAVLAAPTGGLSIGLAGFLGVSATVASAIIATGLSLVAATALSALAGKPKALAPTPINFRQAIGNSFILIGKRRQGGQMCFFHPRKVGSDHYRYFVFASAGHRCKGVVSWMLGDEIVTVDGSGMVTSGAYAGGAWLWFQRGTADQAANATFVAECDGKWTTDHRGRGVAAIYAKFKMTKDVVAAGQPTVSAIWEGADEIVDPRTGEAGYTTLAIPAFYWWMRLPREEGGFGISAEEVPDASLLSAWTNICDEDVAIPGGETEKRYTFNSLIETGAPPSEVRSTFVTCCAGTFTYSEGRHLLRPGYWVPSSVALSEDDLAGPIDLKTMLEDNETATEVQASFVDPASNYQPQPVPTRSVTSTDVRQMAIDLPHIDSHWRGQRISEIMLRRAQCEKRLAWPMNIMGLGVAAMDTVQCATARYSLSNYAFVVDGWGLASDFNVGLSLREENAEIYELDVADYKPLNGGAIPATAEPVPDADTAALQTTVTDQADLIEAQADLITAQADALATLTTRINDYTGGGPIP